MLQFKRTRVKMCALVILFLLVYNPSGVHSAWSSDFVRNSKTLPSIELRISPPEKPLPQLEKEIELLETDRINLEERMMATLEDVFNDIIVTSRKDISKMIESVGCAMKQTKFSHLSLFAEKEFFTKMVSTVARESHSARGNKQGQPPLGCKHCKTAKPPFFLQENQEFVPSSVRVMMSDVEEPDPVIKDKMNEMEQTRKYEEVQTFQQEKEELVQLTKITLNELERNLKVHLSPYLAKLDGLDEAVNQSEQVSKLGLDEAVNQSERGVSFLQMSTSNNPKQLNVKIGQSDTPYPTVDDYVMNMAKRRDAAERAGQNRVLEMYLKLIKAHHLMIKEELQTHISQILSQYGEIVDGLKA